MTEFYNFESFFKKATEYPPFPYQIRLAESSQLPQIINAPTGAGKTAGAVLAWLWKRRFAEKSIRNSTPRRLVYCLPMRSLVEQTRDEVKKWLDKLGLSMQDYQDPAKSIALTVLMGGEDADDWDSYPERDAIIIGTQDMLLSRALNRGYGMSRYRWPVHFGLLNEDCLWVMDEVQLMGVGVETSAQLDAFRKSFGNFYPSRTIWMSATIPEERIATVDNPAPAGGWDGLRLDDSDIQQSKTLQERLNAKKPLSKSGIVVSGGKNEYPAEDIAEFVLSKHIEGDFTLVVVNQVKRAQDVYKALMGKGRTMENTVLLHSRYRETDRKANLEKMKQGKEKDMIAVSTQVVEAGMDISASILISELAPWSSMVQRFGRCNRFGKQQSSSIYWIDIDGDNISPYDSEDLKASRRLLECTEDASPKALQTRKADVKIEIRPVIRRKDVLELFDTTPDLTGNDLDISRYVRDGDDKDIQVFWRNVPEGSPLKDEQQPQRAELCSAPIGDFSSLIKNERTAFRWNHLEGTWERIYPRDPIWPGLVVMLAAEDGGYSPDAGWDPKLNKRVDVILERRPPSDSSMGSNISSDVGRWVTLAEHSQHVTGEIDGITESLNMSEDTRDTLKTAARWHDAGKAHPIFQKMLQSSGEGAPDSLLAKSPTMKGRCERKDFRHELASAMVFLQATDQDNTVKANIIAYLIASHHGKVRLSIRSLPNESNPSDGHLFARGIWAGDTLPILPGLTESETKIDLSFMQLGEGCWSERTLQLRGDPRYGPFRIALLEALLRAADWRASAGERKHGKA